MWVSVLVFSSIITKTKDFIDFSCNKNAMSYKRNCILYSVTIPIPYPTQTFPYTEIPEMGV